MPLLTPMIAEFQHQNPDIRVNLVVDARIFKLEHGEAHISLRPGAKPKDPDYVVQHLQTMKESLYASPAYLQRYGAMKNLADYHGHRFLASTRSMPNIPSQHWLEQNIPESQVYFRVSDVLGLHYAAEQGLGIAPLNDWMAAAFNVQRLFQSPADWCTNVWLVTHRDMHRTAKVQAFARFIKTQFAV